MAFDTHDPLTGAYTRSTLQGRLDEEIARARRYQKSFSLLLVDLDYFKSINDAFGHQRGDTTLIEFADRLRAAMRSADLLFRYGGDEFLLLLPDTNKEQASQAASRILKDINELPFDGDPPLTLAVSIGVASFPDDGDNPMTLFEVADQRHYFAKRNGRGQVISEVQVAAPPDTIESPDRLIQREHAQETLKAFFEQLPEEHRGILLAYGPPGSGKSRYLEEARRLGRLHGYGVLRLRGTAALRNRRYGALIEAHWHWENLPHPTSDPGEFARAITKWIEEKGYQGLVLLFDDAGFSDPATLEYLKELFYLAEVPMLGLICTHLRSSLAGLPDELPLSNSVPLTALTHESLRVWLRHALKWEASEQVVAWLHQQSGGWPARVQSALEYLHQQNHLVKNGIGWHILANPDTLSVAHVYQPASQSPATHLPGDSSLFIGRENELRTLRSQLTSQRLTTIIGPPGIGKTRLAIQAARELGDYFSGGVYFLRALPWRSSYALESALANALHTQLKPSRTAKTTLSEALQDETRLLVLDNADALKSALPSLAALLPENAGIFIIATSLHPLSLAGEHSFDLTGLPWALEETQDSPERFPAVQLYVQHARRQDPEFGLNDANREQVLRICRLLGGLPLALELAAAWTQSLQPHEILAEIERHLGAQAANAAPAEPRDYDRVLQAVLKTFWYMLSEPEHAVLRRLSVFLNEFTAQDARRVAGASPFFLDALTSKSFLQRTARGTYRFQESIGRFAGDRLAAMPDDYFHTRDRHADAVADWLYEYLPVLRSGDPSVALAHVEIEIENVRAAWDWAASHARLSALNRAAEPLGWIYRLWELTDEGEQAFRQAVEAVGELAQTQPEALRLLGNLLPVWTDFYSPAMPFAELDTLLEATWQASLQAEGQTAAVGTLHCQARLALQRNEFSQARTRLVEVFNFILETGDYASAPELICSLVEYSLLTHQPRAATNAAVEDLRRLLEHAPLDARIAWRVQNLNARLQAAAHLAPETTSTADLTIDEEDELLWQLAERIVAAAD